jgi:hypothetical protein
MTINLYPLFSDMTETKGLRNFMNKSFTAIQRENENSNSCHWKSIYKCTLIIIAVSIINET